MKKYIKYIIPSLITFMVLGIIYYVNGLYPFGIKPLVQVDADYLYIPALYKIYDFLHGMGNIFYADLGLGNSLYASLIIQGSLFSPLNLLLYLVDRDNIINFFGVFIIVKLCLISLTSYIYIDKTYRVNNFYKILYSVLYTFSGFIILNYFNEIWLDIVILFPLLVLYLNKLLMDDKNFGYIMVLTICFIITFYFSYFIVIFILLYSFIYLNLYKKEKVKETILKLGVSTLIAFLISAFSSLPLIYQILISARFSFDTYTGMFSSIAMKSLYLLFSPLLIICFLKLIMKFKNDKVNIYGYIILLFLYIIPVFIDPINALLHGGSYWSFPYRYGFITSFILMDGGLYYVSRYVKDKSTDIFKRDIIIIIVIIILGIIGIKLNCLYQNNIITEGILLKVKNIVYIKLIYMMIIVFAMYIGILLIKNKWFKYVSISVVSLYSIFLFTSWTIYYNSGYFLTTNARDIYNNIDIKTDGRYKMDYKTYTPQYGYMFRVSTLDNWLHIIPKHEIDTYKKLGYYISDMNIHSYGGTIFTDYLLNFKYLLSNTDRIDDDIYKLIDNYNYKYLFKYNYNNNYGVVFNKLEQIVLDNKFDYQNEIYKNLFNTNSNIINYQSYEYIETKEIVINYVVKNDSYLYFSSDFYNNINYISINGNNIYDIGDCIEYLGNYQNDVVIKIYLNYDDYVNFDIGTINKKDIIGLKSNVRYSDNKYYASVEGQKYLFLPINNVAGIHVFNNDKKVKVIQYLDNFICIKLNDGENTITIKYELPLFKIGVALSAIGLILWFFHKRIVFNKLILNISYWAYIILVIGLFIYYYLYSLFKYII